MAIARNMQFDKKQVTTLHIHNRTVRHAFLFRDGENIHDQYVRKTMFLNRFKHLLNSFSVEALGHSVMDNHYHLILRTRPDLVTSWSSEEVARRWWQLYPKKRDVQGLPKEPTEADLESVFHDPKGKLTPEECCEHFRTRLGDVSWFMKGLNEYVSRQYNRQENCSGSFWEGRFKSQVLVDQAAVLACMAYIDLNPIRADLAETPEESNFTSGQLRFRCQVAKKKLVKLRQVYQKKIENKERRRKIQEIIVRLEQEVQEGQWLSPMLAEDLSQPSQGMGHILNMEQEDYLKLLDWTGRQLRQDKKGSIPKDLAPLLHRMDVEANVWLETIQKYDSWFFRFVGKVQTLTKKAQEQGKTWLAGLSAAKKAFLDT